MDISTKKISCRLCGLHSVTDIVLYMSSVEAEARHNILPCDISNFVDACCQPSRPSHLPEIATELFPLSQCYPAH